MKPSSEAVDCSSSLSLFSSTFMLLSADCIDALVSASDGFGSSSSIFVSGSSFESFLQTPHKQVKVICGKKGKENAMKTIL